MSGTREEKIMTGETAEKTEVVFEKQFNGYDREQVDRYVGNLAKAYQAAYDEYNATCAKYNELLEKYKKLEEQENHKPSSEIIAKTLVNTEVLAQQILQSAETEADRIKTAAQEEAKKVRENACVEAAVAKIQSKKLMEEANAEAAAAREKAEQIISDAKTEAAQAGVRVQRERELADQAIKRLLGEIQALLTEDDQTGYQSRLLLQAGA